MFKNRPNHKRNKIGKKEPCEDKILRIDDEN